MEKIQKISYDYLTIKTMQGAYLMAKGKTKVV
jgi:hypothetical protein